MRISCSWHGTELHSILAGKQEGKELLLRSRTGGRILLKWMFKDAGWESKELICLYHHMDPARFVLNAVHMTVHV
jgi:hypothetical protein